MTNAVINAAVASVVNAKTSKEQRDFLAEIAQGSGNIILQLEKEIKEIEDSLTKEK